MRNGKESDELAARATVFDLHPATVSPGRRYPCFAGNSLPANPLAQHPADLDYRQTGAPVDVRIARRGDAGV